MSEAKTDPYGETLSGDDPALARTVSADAAVAPSGETTQDSDGSRPSIVTDMRPSAALTSEHRGRYQPQGEIGRGGMGRVTLVFDEHLGREVAMKELLGQAGPGDVGVSIGAVARFLREARITGQLEHPSIVPVHELGQRADGTIYYTMKRIRGRSLKSVLEEKKDARGRLEVMSAFRDVCQAIAYAHARGVVHRDLKPENVMVGEFGETLVVDWGLAKVRGEKDPRGAEIERRIELLKGADAAHTMGGHAIGTPAYMSPEQARGDLAGVDERSDVWGLGAMLFEILTGRTPYAGASAFEVLRKVLEEPPPRVRAIAPDAPPELAAIADRALMRDPSSRYPGAKELADEIAAWQDGRTVRAYEYSSWELVRRFVKRNRPATIAAVSVALASIAATILVWRSFVAEQAARSLAERRASDAAQARWDAEDSARHSQISLAQALLERGERALEDGDPAGAAIYAAATLALDPTHPRSTRYAAELSLDEATRRAARQRLDRAHSLYAEADAARGWVFERAIPGIDRRAAIRADGAAILMPATGGLARIDLSSGERSPIAIEAGAIDRVLAFVGADRALLRGTSRGGAPSGLYDLTSGTLVYPTIDPLAASHAGGRLAAIDEQGVLVIYDAISGAELERVATEHRSVGLRVHLAPDASKVIAFGRTLGRIDLWTVPIAGRAPTAHDLGAWTRYAAFSPDARQVAIGLNAAELRVLALEIGAANRVPTGAWPSGLAWIDLDRIAVLEGDVVIRHARTGRAIDRLHAPIGAASLMLQAGRRIVVLPARGGTQAARVFRETPARGRESRGLDAIVESIAWDGPRSRVVCLAGRDVIAIELRRHRWSMPARLATIPEPGGLGYDLDIASDGAIALATSNGSVVVVEPDGTARVVLPPEPDRIGLASAIAWDRDGQTIFAASTDMEHGILRRATRQGVVMPSVRTAAHVYGLSLSHDGRWLASAEANGEVRILDARDPARAIRTLHDMQRLAGHAAFSPDDRRIATTDGVGGVRVFDAETGILLVSELVHDDWANRIGWSEDGRRLVSAADDGTVRVLAADSLRALRILRTSGATLRAALTRDGDLIASDGMRVIREEAVPLHDREDPAQLLRAAEERAGVELDGMRLLASD